MWRVQALQGSVSKALRFFFKKADRILKRSEFVGLSEYGRRVHSVFFIAVAAPGRCDRSRLGITVSRKIGGAVQRNRIKRLAREFFRKNQYLLKSRLDINLIARRGVAEQPTEALFEALRDLFVRLARQFEG
jgi:ribonuclease P protein component